MMEEDITGLRMAGAISGQTDFFEIFSVGFFTDCSADKLNINTDNFLNSRDLDLNDKREVLKFSRILNQFFLTLVDLFTNELDIPTQLDYVMTNIRTEFRTSKVDNGSKYYEDSILDALQLIALAHCPSTIEKLSDAMKKVTQNPEISETFIDRFIDVDLKTKIVNLKPWVLESLKRQLIDPNRFWKNKTLTEKLVDAFKYKLPKKAVDFLATCNTTTQLPKVLKQDAVHSSFWKDLKELTSFLFKIGNWDIYLENFLRCVNFYFKSAVDFASSKDALVFIVTSVEDLIEDLVTMGFRDDDRIIHFVNSVDQIKMSMPFDTCMQKRKPSSLSGTDEGSLQDTMAGDMKISGKKDRSAYIKDLYQRRVKRIFERIRKRKLRFLNNLAEETKALTKEFSAQETSTGVTCCMTQAALTDQSLYYMIGELYYTNVGVSDPVANDSRIHCA